MPYFKKICHTYIQRSGEKYNADIDVQDQQGETPLMLAVMCEHEDMVKLLIKHGARKDIQNNEGMAALDLCENDKIRTMLS